MNLIFSDQAWEDYEYWQETDKKVVRRIHELLKDIRRNPQSGIGKPEPLRHSLAGWWSRRIDQEHRIVYRVTGRGVELAQMRYHDSCSASRETKVDTRLWAAKSVWR